MKHKNVKVVIALVAVALVGGILFQLYHLKQCNTQFYEEIELQKRIHEEIVEESSYKRFKNIFAMIDNGNLPSEYVSGLSVAMLFTLKDVCRYAGSKLDEEYGIYDAVHFVNLSQEEQGQYLQHIFEQAKSCLEQ